MAKARTATKTSKRTAPKKAGAKAAPKPAAGSAKPAAKSNREPSAASSNGQHSTKAQTSALAQAFGSAWDYAPAPERFKLEIKDRYDHFIAGAFTPPQSGEHFATINPATEATLSHIAQGTEADVDRAVAAARDALPAWSGLPGTERAKYLFRIARRIQERARELAVLETMDGGKPIRESRDVDIPLAAAHFFYHAGWCDKLEWVFAGRSALRADSSGRSALRADSSGGSALRADSRLGEPTYPELARGVRPVGVCGQIIPWNFPLLMAAWKLAPALACGNTVVLKPAEATSLTALRLAEILQEVELPAGVVNIVTGDGRTGAALVNHPGVDKIAFTGSTEVGKKIAKATASTSKRLTLELGGKSPHIIFEDASLDQAVEGIIQGIYFNQGHVCCAGSRLFVQESVLDVVVKRLRRRLATLRIGDPMDKNTDVGAINSEGQLGTIRRYLDAGVAEGADLFVGGELGEGLKGWKGNGNPVPENGAAKSLKGYWCRPCLFTGVQPSQVVAREEIFGPVLAVMSFRTPEEALQRANNTPYGLAAGVWTDKGSKIFEIARKLRAGVVWCNTYNMFDPASPFGGYKESGFGREGGVQGLRGYVRLD